MFLDKQVKMPAQEWRGGVAGDLEVLVILGQGGLLRLLDVLLDLLLPLGVHGHLERKHSIKNGQCQNVRF